MYSCISPVHVSKPHLTRTTFPSILVLFAIIFYRKLSVSDQNDSFAHSNDAFYEMYDRANIYIDTGMKTLALLCGTVIRNGGHFFTTAVKATTAQIRDGTIMFTHFV